MYSTYIFSTLILTQDFLLNEIYSSRTVCRIKVIVFGDKLNIRN